MNLLLCSVTQLRSRYGERATRRVQAAMDELVAARTQRGIRSQVFVVEQGQPDGAVAPAPVTAEAIAAQLAAVAAALEHANDRLESVLIVGGPDIIPFDMVPNPTPSDGDAFVPSDNLYGMRESAGLMPEWAVGRLPGDEGQRATGELLVRLLRQAARLHRREPPRLFAKTFGYTTAVWAEAAAQVYAEISDTPIMVSPPQVAASLDLALLDGCSAVYCNLHGVRDGPVWYGQATSNSGYLLALRVEDVLQANMNGALVFSEACYGAALGGRDEQSSMALAFLTRGAACFIGATALSYGPAVVPLSEADLLALHFWRSVRRGGTTIGMAFLEARAQMLIDTLARQNTLDEDDRKTALEFVLYADPTLPV